ncbi:MAG: alpha-amylase, partial [Planctomycetes bacterium]|nr:alpha-amylase [Planctomycetota bacterium]
MNHSPLTTHHSPSAPSAALPRFEFHISRKARVRYQFDQSLYSLTGNVILADYRAVRALADKMNAVRDAKQNPDQAVRAGQLNAMGLIDEILHFVAARYRAERNPNAMAKALNWLGERMGQDALDRTLLEFVTLFPPLAVHQSQQTPSQYLAGETGGYPHRCIVLEEVMLLSLTNENPAFAPFIELFDDADLRQQPGYVRIKSLLDDFFRTQPTYGPYGQMLTDLLRAPVKASPYSLTGQLLYIKEHWRFFIPGEMLDRLVHRLLVALDYIQEEERPRGLGPGPAVVPTFREGALATDLEWEQYSSDLDWMPKAVLMVKHTYVWLHQLSVKYGRGITRLDQVPDEELDMLGQWGFTGLWLIGLWQRSPASAKIKQRCGNPEAISSAYSLYAYEIADELGGYAAFDSLRARAWQRGIRMAVDMVPNHVGLYSRWTVEHPDWFIQLDHPPFPSYGFSGHDLSDDDRIGLQIEDGYWSRSDAAVVFKWWNKRTGETRYIYHGNDGTCMPWNDTAQLNFLIPAVREAVIQEILKVARHAPIIRFDAAMTLTKRHYHRLWYPEPGSGGDIPSRAGRGMSRPDFDHVFPQEFWREVVDRVAKEAPDTLLLAEAFWLMEGYFVRTLGMHRVYNSAFMNMLKAEENANYRSVIKNILEFDPEILRRLVNFMNNPDEQTAVAQFGKGDKYLGVCLMMATMPGLPMFGHGQLEGFTEKYGMEYRRAYWDEPTDWDLLERHKREVFPLLRKRYLFSGTENFFLYDLYDRHGKVNEDVFAYSNRCGHERALVLYNNRYAHAAGCVRM